MKFDKKIVGLAMATIASAALTSPAHAALCEYVVQSEWNNGFVAAIRITNNTTTPINGWNVNWAYTDDSRRTSGWNANVSGNNPYSASGVGWNDTIYPGQSVEFGIQGTKSNNAAQRPTVTGAVCNNASSAAPIPSSSSRPSSSSVAPASSSIIPSSSSVAPSSSSIRPSSVSSSRSSVSSSPSSASEPSSSAMSSYIYSMPASSSSMSSVSQPVSSVGISSQSASSVTPNNAPLPSVAIGTNGWLHGEYVLVDTRSTYDPEGDNFTSTVYIDNQPTPDNFSYKKITPGNHTADVEFIDATGARSLYSTTFFIADVNENHAPIARLAWAFDGETYTLSAVGSFDKERQPLSFLWNTGNGDFYSGPEITIEHCQSPATMAQQTVSLTVSDGTYSNQLQLQLNETCHVPRHSLSSGEIDIDRFTNAADHSATALIYTFGAFRVPHGVAYHWDFGDGHTDWGLQVEHEYLPGDYITTFTVYGLDGSVLSSTKPWKASPRSSPADMPIRSSMSSAGPSSVPYVSYLSSMRSSSIPDTSSSSAYSSSSSVTYSAAASSVHSSRSSSSVSSVSYPALPNHYYAPRATIAPVIDGVADAIWSRASWTNIDVFWLGTQPNPSAEDYSGRYKALWDENYLYLLVDITDDVLYDGVRDPLDRYWEDDTVELFIDEDKSGGDHGYSTNAWAYHISTLGDVVDITNSGAKLLNDHITVKRVSQGSKHLWELRISIYGDDYADWKPVNVPRTLFSGKIMGFSASYIDNDGSPQRESMMGSVNTQGHKNNQGYLNADVFGSLQLVD
jgi:hypothetical protein